MLTIEENLDSTIRAPQRHKEELVKFVHRPVFRHVLFNGSNPMSRPFSTNVATLSAVVGSLDIQKDPYVHSLRSQLARAMKGSADYHRIDQKLSKVIQKEDSFTHKGLRDFARTADAICQDLGVWAADWYVWEVIQHAKRAANPFNNIISTWKNSEKAYLLKIIESIVVSPVSYYPDDIVEECSGKVTALIETLLAEKLDAEAENEAYSALVFVQRRDTVLALAELLRSHPFTMDQFRFGCLLGTSDSSYRHSFLDITRFMLKDSHQDTLDDFKIGLKSVIISTAVAEEGIDIQACGSVIRWDLPPNMASWAQSRGRARKKRSTYTMMFERGGQDRQNVLKWQELERQMVALYNDPLRDLVVNKFQDPGWDKDDEVLEFRVPSTAYKALYDAGLLNEQLLPITSLVEPHLEEEVKEMLKDVEQRAGFANVSLQVDPWKPQDTQQSTCCISCQIYLPKNEGPILYQPGQPPIPTYLKYLHSVELSDERIEQARTYTKMLFWSLNGSRMVWDNDDFAYLFLPLNIDNDDLWKSRRKWLSQHNKSTGASNADEYFANAQKFGEAFSYPTDLTLVRNGFQFAKGYRFVRWRYDSLNEEEELELRKYYSRFEELEITYPLLVVEPLPARSNFLVPIPPSKHKESDLAAKVVKSIFLLPSLSAITLLSNAESQYAFLLPSILRSLTCSMTVSSLCNTLFAATPLNNVSPSLLLTAVTTPVSGERTNYQRLETLGDCVLKYIAGIQIMAEYPLWHEGYLTKRKDHAVSNVRLAKENIKRGLYRWIIRDRMLGKKWKPNYITTDLKIVEVKKNERYTLHSEGVNGIKRQKKEQELSTKVLADVVESLIGAAYLHGGFDLGYECAKFFDLGLKWEPIPTRIQTLLSHIKHGDEYPSQLSDVERILGYIFQRKQLLIEALTHASYEHDSHNTPSYERLEFLGDSVLDIVVTDILYHAPGKNYSPGHIHLRRSSVVNGHFLSYICLSLSTITDATMPGLNDAGMITLLPETHDIRLWQCLLHSSPRVLEDQRNTAVRFKHLKDDIHDALASGGIFPWADLIRLQAPKFFSDMVESLIGAVFLDSAGNIDTVRSVIAKIGILPILERIIKDDVDVLHPVSRLSMWASRHDKKLGYRFEKEKGKVTCVVMVDGKEECRCTEVYHGRASQEEVKFMAAELAIKIFHLRDVDVNYTLLKKRAPRRREKTIAETGTNAAV
ncbi:hypothetical protein H0H87_001109 [Tephrocybe sp. NHM501043]|nr:hypothetical protein H0H87_001109 [Tephrocybe sp. NHM501043]